MFSTILVTYIVCLLVFFPLLIQKLVLLFNLYLLLSNISLIHKLQDTLVIKSPKKSPLILVILLFVMVCGVYICSIYLNQISTHKKVKLLNIKVMEQPCQAISIEPSEVPYVHYPKPKTY